MSKTKIDAQAPDLDPESQKRFFPSRRSVVHSINGMVACTQPLAAEAGHRILRQGGNAADAAVAVAAALGVTEPASTGIGGDMFCLFYNAKTQKVHALNGSGRSPARLDLPGLKKELDLKPGEGGSMHYLSVHALTVPGAAAGWVDTVESFGSGKLSLEEILTPAIELGEEGFPVSEFSAKAWGRYEHVLRNASPNFRELLKRDSKAEHFARAPTVGEVVRNPTLAKTLRTLAVEGKEGFYTGRIAKSIADVAKLCGGHLDLDDLKHHLDVGPHHPEPMSIKVTGHGIGAPGPDSGPLELWEHPPNGQGIVALMAIGILQALEKSKAIDPFSSSDHNSPKYLHAVIEALRIALADANWWVTDPHPDHSPNLQTPSDLISDAYLAERAKLFSPTKCCHPPSHGHPSPARNTCDTVYFSVTDKEGNGISFINSLYSHFGSGIIPEGYGFPLQNRGANFQLGPADHPNIYAPRKRPYHTIIPALVTRGGTTASDTNSRKLHYVYGVMGGFMQPQGHVQVLMNMEVFGMDPQRALDAPRVCIGAGMPDAGDVFDRTVYVEEGVPEETVAGLRELGHTVKVVRRFDPLFGKGQVIGCRWDGGVQRWVYSAGSDPRGDGCAFPG